MTDMRDIKGVIKDRGLSITLVAQRLAEYKKGKYSLQNLSNKIRRRSLRYEEALDLFEVMGYEMVLVRKKNTMAITRRTKNES